jgi:hypothetical protein
MTINVWSKVAVAVQTALASAKTITAITKANPGVATSVAHGYADGDILLLKVSGMIEANHMLVRVAAKTTDTFQLEGVDTTLFNTFVSGTAEKPTFGAAAATITSVSSSGGDVKAIDITTIHDDTDREQPGNKSAITYSFDNLWDPADPALIELRKADLVKGERAVQITFASGAKVYFNCYPSASLAPGGSKGEAVTTPTSFKLRGPITPYAS